MNRNNQTSGEPSQWRSSRFSHKKFIKLLLIILDVFVKSFFSLLCKEELCYRRQYGVHDLTYKVSPFFSLSHRQ